MEAPGNFREIPEAPRAVAQRVSDRLRPTADRDLVVMALRN
jgi:hypothetical protein